MDNTLNMSGVWDTRNSNLIASQNVFQKLRQPSFAIADECSWIFKTSEKKGVSLNAAMGFVTSPQHLSIIPGLYPELFNDDKPYDLLRQDVQTDCYSLNVDCHLLSPWIWGNFSAEPRVSIWLTRRSLKSEMYTQESGETIQSIAADSMKNYMSEWHTSLKTTLKLSYESPYLTANIHLPIAMNILQLKSAHSANSPSFRKLYFAPSIEAYYKLGTNLGISAAYSFQNKFSDLFTLYQGYILSGYRNLSRFDGKLAESNNNSGNLSFEYKDIFHIFFKRMSASYSYSSSNVTYGQNFYDIISIQTFLDTKTSSNNYSLGWNLSKGLNWKKTLISGNAAIGRSHRSLLQQEQLLDVRA